MAASKKSTPKKTEEPTEADLPEESVSEEHPVEPIVEDPPVEANEDGPVEPGAEQPRTADEAVAETTASPEPTPWRVETYSDGVQWGWRLCAANGNIIRESGTFFDTKDAALADADDASDTAGATFVDRNTTGVTARGWR